MKSNSPTTPAKILLTADLHTEHSAGEGGVEGDKQGMIVLDIIDEIANSVPNLAAEVSAGDLFDNHGLITSSRANFVKQRYREKAKKRKVIVIAGNHEYEKISREYFGRSLLSAVFSGLEGDNIFVIDQTARAIRIDETTVVVGLPYRDNEDDFISDCLEPICQAVADGEIRRGVDKVLVCWHVGLPFEGMGRIDETVNGWITVENPGIRFFLDLAHDHTIYGGHYHAPSETVFGESGKFVYIGSPVSRSRSESEQVKRVMLWSHQGCEPKETGLVVDKIVDSYAAASAYQKKMVDMFGPRICDVLTVHINLGPEASLDSYHITKQQSKALACHVYVEKPNVSAKSSTSHLWERARTDAAYTKAHLEKDIGRIALLEHFKSRELRGLPTFLLEAIPLISFGQWREAAKRISCGEIAFAVDLVVSYLPSGISEAQRILIGEHLSVSLCETAARLSLAMSELERIIEVV